MNIQCNVANKLPKAVSDMLKQQPFCQATTPHAKAQALENLKTSLKQLLPAALPGMLKCDPTSQVITTITSDQVLDVVIGALDRCSDSFCFKTPAPDANSTLVDISFDTPAVPQAPVAVPDTAAQTLGISLAITGVFIIFGLLALSIYFVRKPRRPISLWWNVLLFFITLAIVILLLIDPWCFFRTCKTSDPLTVPSGTYSGRGGMLGVYVNFKGDIDFANNVVTLTTLTCENAQICPANNLLQDCSQGNNTVTISRVNPSVYGYSLLGGCLPNIENVSKGILNQARLRQDNNTLWLSLMLTIKGITIPDFRIPLVLN